MRGPKNTIPTSRRRVKKRNSFTLLEVMVCVALLSLLAGTCAWKGHDLLQHYLLRSSAKAIVREIEAAQILSLSYQADIAVTLVKEKEEFFLKWETEEPRLQYRCIPRKMRGVKNARIDYKRSKKAKVADFSSASSSSCAYIDLEGKNEGCRIELQQGRPLRVRTIHHAEEEE